MLNCSDKHMKKEATAEGSVHSVLLRRFACSVCLKLFDSAAQQRVHERTEHGENREEFDVSNQAKHLLEQEYLSNHVYILIIPQETEANRDPVRHDDRHLLPALRGCLLQEHLRSQAAPCETQVPTCGQGCTYPGMTTFLSNLPKSTVYLS